MTKEMIEKRIEEVEKAIFYEQMADFMNWKAYYKLTAELKQLKKWLKLLEH